MHDTFVDIARGASKWLMAVDGPNAAIDQDKIAVENAGISLLIAVDLPKKGRRRVADQKPREIDRFLDVVIGRRWKARA